MSHVVLLFHKTTSGSLDPLSVFKRVGTQCFSGLCRSNSFNPVTTPIFRGSDRRVTGCPPPDTQEWTTTGPPYVSEFEGVDSLSNLRCLRPGFLWCYDTTGTFPGRKEVSVKFLTLVGVNPRVVPGLDRRLLSLTTHLVQRKHLWIDRTVGHRTHRSRRVSRTTGCPSPSCVWSSVMFQYR